MNEYIDYIYDIKEKVSKNALKAMELIEAANEEAYLVGGCVRDILCNMIPNDFDLTTSATTEKLLEIFNGYTVIPTGIKHGTITVLIEGEQLEITTFREESGYSDGRRPDRVVFSKNIIDDLRRRDFTMNSIALNSDGKLVDPFGGFSDIKGKVIRCVGNPVERFGEDGLRILRAIRFSAVFGFSIENETSKSVHKLKYMIEKISAERIRTEFNKILLSAKPSNILREYIDVICVFIPELKECIGFEQKNRHHIYDVFEHTLRVVDSIAPKLELRLAALFHDIGKPSSFTVGKDGEGHFYGHARVSAEMSKKILKRLKYDNKTVSEVYDIVIHHDLQIENRDKIIKRCLLKFGEKCFFDLIEMKKADNSGQAEELRYRTDTLCTLEKNAREIIASESCFSLKTLAVNGNDLIELGLKRGVLIGSTLSLLLEKVICGELDNDRDVLLEYTKINVL